MTADRKTSGKMVILAFLAGLVGACSDQPVSTQRDLDASLRLDIVSGQEQVAKAGTTLPEPLVVRVTGTDGQAIGNQIVNFTITGGGGSVFAGTALTNAQGVAQEWWTLGAEPGANTLEARAVDSKTGERLVFATFTATGSIEAPVLTTFAISPASVSIAAGATAPLSVSAKDQYGNALHPTVAWRSLNTAVATVSAAGVVSGVAGGNTKVIASAGTKADTTDVTVGSSAPPPSGDVIFSTDFESGTLTGWDDGLDPAKHRILTDATLAHGGSRLLEMSYPAGGNAGWLTEFFMPGYESVKVSYWVRLSSNWTGGSKLIGVRGSPDDNQWAAFGKAGVCPNGTDFFSTGFSVEPTANPGPLHFYTYYPGMPSSSGSCYGSIGQGIATYDGAVQLTRGRWHHVEYSLTLNTPGQNNGVQRLWVDGKLAGEWKSLNLRTTDKLKINSVMLSGDAMGASDQKLYVDDVVVTRGDGATTTPTPSPTVSSVTVSPSSVSLTSVGQTSQLAASAVDQNGNPISTTFGWTTSNAAVATVSSSGRVTAVAAGTARVVASAAGKADTASVTVSLTTSSTNQGTQAPEPSSSSTVLHRDDFNSYQSIDGTNALTGTYAITPARPSLVSGRGSSGNAVRFAYRPGVSDILIEKTFSTSTDVFVRYWYRTSPGADPTQGGAASDGIKWFMAHRSVGQRYTMGVGSIRWSAGPEGFSNTGLEFSTHDNGSTSMPNPFVQNITKAGKFGVTNDGQWHKYTIQIRTGNGGFERIWIDGTLVLDSSPGAPGVPSSGYDHQAGGINRISFPGNLVTPLQSGWEFHIDVDDLVVWRQ